MVAALSKSKVSSFAPLVLQFLWSEGQWIYPWGLSHEILAEIQIVLLYPVRNHIHMFEHHLKNSSQTYDSGKDRKEPFISNVKTKSARRPSYLRSLQC